MLNGCYVVRPIRADALKIGDTVLPFGKFRWCCYPYEVTKVSINKRTWKVRIGLASCMGEGEPVEWVSTVQTNHTIAKIIR